MVQARRGLRFVPILLVFSWLVTSTGLAAAAAIAPSPGTDDGATAIARAILAEPSQLISAGFATTPSPIGRSVRATPGGTSARLGGFPTNGSRFGILTTGDVGLADDANLAPNSGADLGGASVRGGDDHDVTILRLDLAAPAGTNCLRFDVAFATDEDPESSSAAPGDWFVAELDASDWTTAGGRLRAAQNVALDPDGRPLGTGRGAAPLTAGAAGGTTYDLATGPFVVATPVTAGRHRMYLSVLDGGDGLVDSAAFIDNLRFASVAGPARDCRSERATPTARP